MSEWISITDKAPPKDIEFLGYVLIGYDYGKKSPRPHAIHVCIWDDLWGRFRQACDCSGYEHDREYIDVSHWKPLPDKPKDEK